MGILADILELVEKAESGKERATPEKVLALAVRNEERRQQYKDSRKDDAESVWEVTEEWRK